MILHCPSCSARYTVPAEAAAKPGVTFRCTNCETTFAPAEGAPASENRPPSASTNTARHASLARVGVHAGVGAPVAHRKGVAIHRPLPPSNVSPQPATEVSRDGQSQASSFSAQNVPGTGGLPAGFRGDIFESQSPAATTTQESVPSKMDELPASRGVRFDSQPSEAISSSSSADEAMHAKVAPVEPIDAETLFDEESGTDASVSVGPWGADSSILTPPDESTPSRFDSDPLDAFAARQPSPAGVPPVKSMTRGIRRISPPSTRSSSAAVVLPTGSLTSVSTGAATSIGSPASEAGSAPVHLSGRNTDSRLSERHSEAAIAREAVGSENGPPAHTPDVETAPARVTQKIDPLVEFHDVFQDIRRAEKGDDRSATERYFDPGLFSDAPQKSPEFEENARVEREEREARLREGRLNLKAGVGGIAQRVERASSMTESSPEEADDVLAAALAESGLREPSADVATLQEGVGRSAVLNLGVTGDSLGTPIFPTAARYLTVLLVLFLVSAGLLGFVASKNNGILDFGALDQMLGVAFKGEVYAPSDASVAQVVQSTEEWVAERAGGPLLGVENALTISDLVGGQYEAGHGAVFTLIDGTVTNTTEREYRGINVEVSLASELGEVVAVRVVPAGARVEQPLLEEVVAPTQLHVEYERLAGRLADVQLAPAGVTTFSAVFLLPEGVRASDLTSIARVVDAERALESCWGAVRFETLNDGAVPALQE